MNFKLAMIFLLTSYKKVKFNLIHIVPLNYSILTLSEMSLLLKITNA